MAKDKIGGTADFVQHYPTEDPQIGVLYQIIGLGHQEVRKYQSNDFERKNQMMFIYELSFDIRDFNGEEKPLTVIETHTRSLNEKANLYSRIKSIRGAKYFEDKEEVDWKKDILGAVIQITCVLKQSTDKKKTYVNVDQISRPIKGSPIPEQLFNPKAYFDITDDKPDWDAFLLLWPWLQIKLSESTEYATHVKAKNITQEAFQAVQTAIDEKANRGNKSYTPKQTEEEKKDIEEGQKLAGTASMADDDDDDDYDGTDPFDSDDEDPFTI